MGGRSRSVSGLLGCLLAVVLLAGSAEGATTRTPSQSGSNVTGGTVELPAVILADTCGPGEAWIGSPGDELACLDSGGWKPADGSDVSPWDAGIRDAAVCADGTRWLATSPGLVATDGLAWTSHSEATDNHTFDAIACAPDGGIWLAGYDLLAYFDGTTMTTYPVSELGTGEFVSLLKDVAVAPDGRVWVATASSVAVYNGSKWRFFEKGKGLKAEYSFEQLAVDHHGRVWAGSSDGILMYDGHKWTAYAQTSHWQIQALAVDYKDRLWVGTYSGGVSVYDGRRWLTYTRANSDLPSDSIKSLATDARGRVWIGTEWGLAILTGKTWRVYHMADSGIPDNEVTVVAVAGRGPQLPPPVDKQPGVLTGRIVKSGVAQAGLKVEICVEFVGFLFTGPSPCSDQPFHKATTTGTNGRFTFRSLPVGDYCVTVRGADGKWTVLSNQWGIGSQDVAVREGETTDIGDMDLAKSK